MSIEERNGKYRVRIRVGAKHVSRTFDFKRDAVKAEGELRRMAQGKGLIELERGKSTLGDHLDSYLDSRELTYETVKTYSGYWERYAKETIGSLELRDLTPKRLHEWMNRDLRDVPAPTKKKAVGMVQGILSTAVIAGELEYNPIRELPKPKVDQRLAPEPFTIAEVEAIRGALDLRDRTMVSVLAYAGLRPKELLELPVSSVKERTLRVWGSKTRRERPVHLYDHLRDDLAEWDSGNELLFPDVDWRNWRRRNWKSALDNLGIGTEFYRADVPYRLRSTYVSLTIADGRWSPGEVALMSGHTLEVMSRHYAGITAEMAGQNHRVEDAVANVRGKA